MGLRPVAENSLKLVSIWKQRLSSCLMIHSSFELDRVSPHTLESLSTIRFLATAFNSIINTVKGITMI